MENETEQEQSLKKWTEYIKATTGERSSKKQMKRLLLQKLDSVNQKAAMALPFEFIPKSVMGEVVATYQMWLSDFVPVGGEAANESADEIEQFFIERDEFFGGLAENGRKKMLSERQINTYKSHNNGREMVAEVRTVFNELEIDNDKEDWSDYELWKERTRVIMQQTGR